MPARGLLTLMSSVGMALAAAHPACAQLRGTDDGGEASKPVYSIKPSDVPVPPGTKPGEVRRITQPFGAWTLVCDENLKAHTRLCNVSQTFVDRAGALVFSWSLAATRGGAPVFIVRAPAADQGDRTVTVTTDEDPGTPVALATCDAQLCLGFLSLTPAMRRAITAGVDAHIRRLTGSGRSVEVQAPLAGLALAIASIK